MTKLVSALVVALAVVLPQAALATHFRFGQITYTVDSADPRTIHFDVATAWRSDFIGCVNLDFGDGTTPTACLTGATLATGVAPDGQQYAYTVSQVDHTYAAEGSYTAGFNSCCRASTLTVDHDDAFQVQARVDARAGARGNPVAAVAPAVTLQVGGIRTFLIPAATNDGAPVTCRFSSTGESLATVMPPAIPGGAAPAISATPLGCLVTWNTVIATNGQSFPLSVAIESTSSVTAQMSKTTVEFIVYMTSAPPPQCSGPTQVTAPIGLDTVTTYSGVNIGGGTLGAGGILLAGASVTPTSGASPLAADHHYVPAAAAVGVHAAAIVFSNALNLSGYCPTLFTVPACPQYGTACSVGVGACQSSGILQCDVAGNVACNATAGMPSAELCDGVDNDCDGQVDQGNPESAAACATTEPGVCADGKTTCNSPSLDCVPNVAPGTLSETCNGLDDDCDNETDEGLGLGDPCSAGVGACLAVGVVACDAMEQAACDAVVGAPTAEVCNTIDDDCDGVTDNGLGLGEVCTLGVGACVATGALVCDAQGGVTCDAQAGTPGAEICGNGVDEDCDGADEPCGVTTSATTTTATVSGATTSGGGGNGGGGGSGAGATGGGCNCTTSSEGQGEAAGVVAVLLGLAISTRRRRTAR